MKTRKLISLCMVVALMLCMGINIYAAGTGVVLTADNSNVTESTQTDTKLDSATTKQDIIVGSQLFVPTIEVQVASSAGIIVNPYKMDYDGTGSKDSMISAGALITNKTKLPMKVSAAPKAMTVSGSNVVYTTEPLAGKDLTAPTVRMSMELANFAVSTGAATAPDVSKWAGATNSSSATVTTAECTTPASIELAAATDPSAVDKVTYGGYRFTGESGGPGWNNTDLIKVSIAFSIEPIV